MDISKFKGRLGEDFAGLESYIADLTGQRDAARKESVDGRKALKAKAETAEALNQKLMEKLGIESPDDVDTLPPAKGQAEALKQLETKLRRYETDLKTRDASLSELTGKHRQTLLDVEINRALAGKEPVDRDVLEAYLRQQVEWQDEQIFVQERQGAYVAGRWRDAAGSKQACIIQSWGARLRLESQPGSGERTRCAALDR